jgi:hypothetical protein
MGQTNGACTNPVTTGCACVSPYVQAPGGVDECIISQALVQQMVAAMTPAAPAVPVPATPAQQVAAAAVTAATTPPSYASAEIPGSFDYTADLETVSNLMSQYGDTYDNPQTVVNAMYAAGIAPGTVSQANALPYLTGITSAATTATTASSFSLPNLPWYAWAGIGVGALVLFGGKK